ncbi:MAG: NAD(P)-dependent alcohol dehydrogenase [Cyanobacteriota bacterium]
MPHAWQTPGPSQPLERREVAPLEPGRDELVLEVLHCGLCHSDVSMIDNAWGMSAYPLVGGHEAVGRVVAVGDGVDPALIGQMRGLGWFAGSCGHCDQCLAGRGNLCDAAEATIVGRPGAFVSQVKARQDWAIPLPEGLPAEAAGPLYCGGITVFAPLFDEGVSPTARVAVIGVGGLGHLALRFCRAWGCEVTAVTSSPAKAEEARQLGAHDVVPLADLADHGGRFDLLINTSNQPLDWGVVIGSLGRLGRLHLLGAVLEPLTVNAFDLIVTRRLITGSPTSSPASLRKMVEFCARHKIVPTVERLPMAEINTAIERLRKGDVRYRFVLDGPA